MTLDFQIRVNTAIRDLTEKVNDLKRREYVSVSRNSNNGVIQDNQILFGSNNGTIEQSSNLSFDGTSLFTNSIRVDGGLLDVSNLGSGQTTIIEVGGAATGNRFGGIDIRTDDTYTDFGLRMIRGNTGANADSEIVSRGTGILALTAYDAGNIRLKTSNADRVIVNPGGNGVVDVLHNGASTFGQVISARTTAGTDGPRIGVYSSTRNKSWNTGLPASSSNFGIFEDGSWASFGTQRFTIATGGNVGIGSGAVAPLITLALGDDDTGFLWVSDGLVHARANGASAFGWNGVSFGVYVGATFNGNVTSLGTITGKSGSTLANPGDAFTAPESGHATSNRASMSVGNWQFGQDASMNGTRDFYLYDINTAQFRMQIDTSGNVGFSGTIKTAAGNTWNMQGHTGAADAVSNGYVTVVIDGVARRLMTRA